MSHFLYPQPRFSEAYGLWSAPGPVGGFHSLGSFLWYIALHKQRWWSYSQAGGGLSSSLQHLSRSVVEVTEHSRICMLCQNICWLEGNRKL